MARRFFFLLFLFFIPLLLAAQEEQEELQLSSPDQIAALNESSHLIGGIISPLSGQPVLRKTDLIATGAQNVTLSRTYIPLYMPCFFANHEDHKKRYKTALEEYDRKYLYEYLRVHYKGWQFVPHSLLQYFPNTKVVRVSDSSGMTLDFHVSSSEVNAPLAGPSYALHNTAGDIPSGKHDSRNTRIAFADARITVYAADGTIRFYDKHLAARALRSFLYRLNKEILPNGKVLKYHYNDRWLTRIESLDPQERYVYASIDIAGSPWDNSWHATNSSGVTANYANQRRKLHWEIKHKRKGLHLLEQADPWCPPILSAVSSPFYRHESMAYCSRFLLSTYRGKDREFGILNTGFDDRAHHFRVHKLFLPVGQNDASEPVYELHYAPAIAGERGGSTTVKNGDGTTTVYHFSSSLLTARIQYFASDNTLKKEKIYEWDQRNWLSCIEMRDGNGALLYKKSYEYDGSGNPIFEKFTGDLTGEGIEQTYITKRIFSQDGRSLLLQEETDDGKIVSLSYLPNTNLVTSKLVKENGKILLRTFSLYDDCHNLIQTISDDGDAEDKNDLSHVTERTSTKYTLRQSAPFLHMPEWIEDTYLEGGVEKCLKKRHLIYDQYGNAAQEEVYDADGVLRYTIQKTYNERGDILSETNCMGQTALYTYDAKGRYETSKNFSERLYTTFNHDSQGRLRTKAAHADDGTVHTISCDYDAQDRLIQKTDPFGNRTNYHHDPIANQVATTQFPPIASLEGSPVSVEKHSRYDVLGRECSRTDANGNTTIYRYNAYGAPTQIIHPTGATETFTYAKNGHCIRYTDPEGLTILYLHDIFDRILSKTYLDREDNFLAEEKYTYNALHLLSETDKEGHLKQYVYDGAGRLVREDHCGRITEYSYDALASLASICKHNGDNTLWTHYARDLEGRVLEERKEDAFGNVLYRIDYSYDSDGHRNTITRYINNKEAVQTFRYDAWGRLIEEIDAKGNATKTKYNEDAINALGQKVIQVQTTDPLNITTLNTKDALDRTVRQETINSSGETIACQEMTFDAQGNVLFQRDHVYEQEQFLKTQILGYTYTADNRIESCTRAFGTPDARTTTYTYKPSAKIASKTLPSGVALFYAYHPLGTLGCLTSSDDAIHHTFTCDRLGRLTHASDENLQIAIQRQLDPFGNILHERFPFGLEVHKTYDALNRPLSLSMNDHGEVLYDYDPLFLRRVTKVNRGEIEYAHSYEAYDLGANMLIEDLIGNLGHVIHAADENGLPTKLSSPYFSQECHYDPVGNCIAAITDQKEERFAYDDLSQLTHEPDHTYSYDSLYNRTKKQNASFQFNDLNEPLSESKTQFSFDLDGNQILKQTPSETIRFSYDPLTRLVSAESEDQKIHFIYDPLGRRLSKTVHTNSSHGWKKEYENYLYDGNNEIGAFSHNIPKNLRILGLALHKDNPSTIAIETGDRIFAPLLDVQNNIRRLVDTNSGTIVQSNDFTAFGEEACSAEKSVYNPWRFASKRFDPELGLIYFGKRYYNPEFARWLTTDPAGFIDGANLYQYVFNNPFYYFDPDGQIAEAAVGAGTVALTLWGAPQAGALSLAALSGPAGLIVAGTFILTTLILWKGSEITQKINNWDHKIDDFYSEKACKELTINEEIEEEKKKKSNNNPFNGPVNEDVVVVDEAGNAINVPQGNWLTGSKDGKWIQEMKPGAGPKGEPTGQRKDGGGHPPPKHTDIRANQPHAHVPGVTNPDGTEWLPLKPLKK